MNEYGAGILISLAATRTKEELKYKENKKANHERMEMGTAGRHFPEFGVPAKEIDCLNGILWSTKAVPR